MPEGYHHLTRDQRCQLAALKDSGESIDRIAMQLNVHRSTIYRELSRNQGETGYEYQQAHAKTIEKEPNQFIFINQLKIPTLFVVGKKTSLFLLSIVVITPSPIAQCIIVLNDNN